MSLTKNKNIALNKGYIREAEEFHEWHFVLWSKCKLSLQIMSNFFFLSKVAPWDTELRIMRADCHENMGDYINAISDIK